MNPRSFETDVLVIGAAVAGCSAAIALRQSGVRVTLVEKASARPLRFCGEFISGEALALLDRLGAGLPVARVGANRVRRLRMYTMGGQRYELGLSAEGLGLSRRSLDSTLLSRAVGLGAKLLDRAGVESVAGQPDCGYQTRVKTHSGEVLIRSRAVIGAYGKRSAVDRILGRKFVRQANPYVGVKCHYRGVNRGDRVELYLFRGGYCGVVGIEGGSTNVCLLATQKAFQENGGRPADLLEAVGRHNSVFGEWMCDAEAVEGTLMAISQIPFRPKRQVVHGVFMAGDSAGVMPPFLGIGVAAALRSGSTCGDVVAQWLRQESDFHSARSRYESWWQDHFRTTQKWGNLASRLLCRPAVAETAVKALNVFPKLGDLYYRRTRTAPREMWLKT